ncbi:MAG TPA: sulfotransferase [Pirellulales bacterium]
MEGRLSFPPVPFAENDSPITMVRDTRFDPPLAIDGDMADDSKVLTTPVPADAKPKGNKYPFWAPKFWHGMTLPVWLRLVARNRFAFSPRGLPPAFAITIVSVINSMASGLQWLFRHRKIARTKIEVPPIFIIGHWRSGTTFLHELMVLDERFAFPTTFECFAPNESLILARFVTRWLSWLLPKQRPMDNMAAGWEHPQEDEFALCNMGLGSPYTQMAFPNRPQGEEYLDMEDVPVEELARWKAGLLRFLKTLTWRSGKPIVLKSPPHTARIRLLLELFPDARFVHIVRDPYVIFSSTVRLWKSLYDVQGFQKPRFVGLGDYVFRMFNRMYRAYFKQRDLIPAANFVEVRYERLVQDPVGEVQALYEHLNLGEFEMARPQIEAYATKEKDYKTNRYELPPATRDEITRRWGEFIERLGYPIREAKPNETTLVESFGFRPSGG